MQIIGHIHSPYAEKFGIPRQSGLVPAARARLKLDPQFAPAEALRGLEDCSHLWILWLAHVTEGWRPTVRPPRLGGNRRMGVYASRSPFRPNPIGLSAVRLEAVQIGPPPVLELSGGDFLDGTPVIDIKPYLPWADALPDAQGGFADQAPAADLAVEFPRESSAEALSPTDRELIRQTLAQDPRPAYHDDSAREYGSRIADWEVRWQVIDGRVRIRSLSRVHG